MRPLPFNPKSQSWMSVPAVSRCRIPFLQLSILVASADGGVIRQLSCLALPCFLHGRIRQAFLSIPQLLQQVDTRCQVPVLWVLCIHSRVTLPHLQICSSCLIQKVYVYKVFGVQATLRMLDDAAIVPWFFESGLIRSLLLELHPHLKFHWSKTGSALIRRSN